MNKFPQRKLEVIVASICKENNIEMIESSQGWIIELFKNNKHMFIYGYNFPNNNSAAAKICDDKSGLSKILQYKNVPTFKYDFFMRGFYSNEEVEASFKRNGGDVVVKPNNGTGGNNVYRCKTLSELNSNIDLIISQHQSFVISKFYEYENEYRVIICNNKNMTIYKKQRQNDWKHNLGLGAIPSEEVDNETKSKLSILALKAIETIGINFCSVDIAELSINDYKIVEINGGVMIEKYSELNPHNAKKIYEIAIKEYFNL